MEGSSNENMVRENAKAVQEAIEALGVPASIHPTQWEPDAKYAVAIDLNIPVPEEERTRSFYAEDGTLKALHDAVGHELVMSAMFEVHPNTLNTWKRVFKATEAACKAENLPEKTTANKNAIYKRYQKIYHQHALDDCQEKAEQFLAEALCDGLMPDEVMKAMKRAVRRHQKTEEVSRASKSAR